MFVCFALKKHYTNAPFSGTNLRATLTRRCDNANKNMIIPLLNPS